MAGCCSLPIFGASVGALLRAWEPMSVTLQRGTNTAMGVRFRDLFDSSADHLAVPVNDGFDGELGHPWMRCRCTPVHSEILQRQSAQLRGCLRRAALQDRSDAERGQGSQAHLPRLARRLRCIRKGAKCFCSHSPKRMPRRSRRARTSRSCGRRCLGFGPACPITRTATPSACPWLVGDSQGLASSRATFSS